MTARTRSKPTVCIIGSGRLGTALAMALARSDYTILALVAEHLSTARRAAALVGRPPLALSARQLQNLPPSELVLVTTPDDALDGVARKLAALQRDTRPRGRTVLHTSGAFSSDILQPLAQAGFRTGSLHPLVSVSDSRIGAEALQGAYYCIEGDTQAQRVARDIVWSLGGHGFRVNSAQKALYHAAAVMSSGNLVALFDLAAKMLVSAGLTRTRARQVLIPLVESTVHNLAMTDPTHALTGTFARGDLATVLKHMEALSDAALPDALEIYKLLGRRSLALAAGKGLDRKIVKRIKKALDSHS